MKKSAKTERSIYGRVSRAFMRAVALRFARGNVRFMLGHWLEDEDVERMRKKVLAHDFTRI